MSGIVRQSDQYAAFDNTPRPERVAREAPAEVIREFTRGRSVGAGQLNPRGIKRQHFAAEESRLGFNEASRKLANDGEIPPSQEGWGKEIQDLFEHQRRKNLQNARPWDYEEDVVNAPGPQGSPWAYGDPDVQDPEHYRRGEDSGYPEGEWLGPPDLSQEFEPPEHHHPRHRLNSFELIAGWAEDNPAWNDTMSHIDQIMAEGENGEGPRKYTPYREPDYPIDEGDYPPGCPECDGVGTHLTGCPLSDPLSAYLKQHQTRHLSE